VITKRIAPPSRGKDISFYDIIITRRTPGPRASDDGEGLGGPELRQAMEVSAMSLSTGDQRALDSIEDGLAGSDPRLASLLATFARLTAGEELPVRERIRAGQGTMRRGVRQLPKCLRGQLVWPFLWLAIFIALIAVALTVSHGGKAPCPGWASACSAQALAHAAGQAGQAAPQVGGRPAAAQPRVNAATPKA
jgi:hypothetical protein